jgi:hypothetical protein
MTTARYLTLTAAACLFLSSSALAADAASKEVTLTGRLACEMCVLKKAGAKTCNNVLVVPVAGKEVIYALADNAVAQGWSMKACSAAMPVKVTGTLTESAGKKTIAAAKIEKS